MPTIRLIPSVNAVSSSSYLTVANANNMYTNTDSTTYATITNTYASTSSRYLYLRGFNFDDIPSGAIISSFTIKVKGYESGLATSTSYAPRLANGTSALSNTTASSNFNTSTSTITIPTGSLTWEQIVNYGSNFTIQVYVRRNNRNTTGYFYCYGAEIEVNYTLPITHTITAASTASGVTATPATQSVGEGESATITFDCNDISGYVVTDNGNDVTVNCVQQAIPGPPTSISAVPGSGVTTSHARSNGAFYQNSYTSSDAWLRYAIGHSAESPYSTSNTSNTYSKDGTDDAITQSWMHYPFDFSNIPANAIIESVQVKVYGAAESNTDTPRHSDVSLWSGDTQKGTTYQLTNTSNSSVTVPDPGTWTRAELQDAWLRFGVGYYGGRLLGVTWTVNYALPSNDHYYTYTIPNVTSDHAVIISEAGPYVPPVEDPTKKYYPITISSINATTTPSNGTTRVEENEDLTITISPSDPQLTLALDNGVDITSQLVGGIPSNTYTVTTQISGANYGFNLNSNTGYYVSTNRGQGSSASVCRVNFDLESSILVTIQYINQGESQCDYGLFGKIDTTVSTTGLTYSNGSASPDDPNNYYYMCAAASDSTTAVKTLTYEIPAGQHYVDIKYGKDPGSNSGNDSLQWKILSIEATSTGGDYTYTLDNINQKHSLIFVFGNVSYYYITSSTTDGARLFPEGQMVKLQGDKYKLAVIPDNNSSTVVIKDNGITVSNANITVETITDANNNTFTEYIYELNNITANHTLIVSIDGAVIQLYIKENNSWTPYSTAYKKINGTWVEVDITTVFNNYANYRKG